MQSQLWLNSIDEIIIASQSTVAIIAMVASRRTFRLSFCQICAHKQDFSAAAECLSLSARAAHGPWSDTRQGNLEEISFWPLFPVRREARPLVLLP